MKIAVFLNEQGTTASLYDVGCVIIYQSSPDKGWGAVREIDFKLTPSMNLAEIRTQTLSMLEKLADCRQFVAQSISGALRSYFDGMGVTMWQLEGDPLLHLERISQQAKQLTKQTVTPPECGAFFNQTKSGYYQINLIEALNCDRQFTSKLILLPFLQQVKFYQLEIICDHLPKWFSRELPTLMLQLSVTLLADGLCCAIISPHQAATIS